MRCDAGIKRKPYRLRQARKKNKMLTSDAAYYLLSKVGKINKTEPTDEDEIKIEEICCSEFGCGNTLTMTEKLFGNKCVEHQFKKKVNFHNGKL